MRATTDSTGIAFGSRRAGVGGLTSCATSSVTSPSSSAKRCNPRPATTARAADVADSGRGARAPPRARGGQEPGHVGLGDLPHAPYTGGGEVLRVPARVAPVGGDRVRGQPAFDGEVVQVAGDDPLDVGSGVQRGGQTSTSWSGTAVMPWASATSGRTTCPAATFTPWASAGLL